MPSFRECEHLQVNIQLMHLNACNAYIHRHDVLFQQCIHTTAQEILRARRAIHH